MKIALILISSEAEHIARTLATELPHADIITTASLPEPCIRVDNYSNFLKQHFADYNGYVFIGALGICVRYIAPYIADKHTDPAVVCVDSTGRYAVSVLSGHIGGANELTRTVASCLGAEAVITTQSDRTDLWPLDTLGTRWNWNALPACPGYEDPNKAMNRLITLFVKQVPTLLCIEVKVPGIEEWERTKPAHVDICYGRLEDQELDRYQLILCISPYQHPATDKPTLYYSPRVLHVGIGLAHQAQPIEDILSAMKETMLSHGLLPQAICDFSTIDEKKEEPVVKHLQQTYPVKLFTAEELRPIEVPNPSDVVQRHMGTSSVSEAAAIASSSGGTLVMEKQKGANYTIAVAMENSTLLHTGHIEIVGAGPGDPDLISVRGRQWLERADLILYAGSLVPRELTLCAKPGATVRSSASLDLEEQFALMKQFYDRGQLVVRLHTGDPCIYGAIQEQMNYFDRYGMNYHITPGISSFQAAAAALKSQFTIPEKVQSIILTRGEGRTPMPEREKLHLMARSQSTMCIFLSAGIADQVQAELLQEYPETTPVAVCYHLTWKDERIFRGQLKDLAQIVHDNKLTLTTLIVVGEAIDNRQGLSRLYAHEFKHLFRP